MINRTYFVKTPNTATFVDICVQAAMGTQSAPVADPTLLAPGALVTAPPSGWAAACGNGAYYEIRGRTLRFDHLANAAAAGGFTQRLNLGFSLSLLPYGNPAGFGTGPVTDGVQLSASLLAAFGGDNGGAGAIPSTVLADPTYGVPQPVIRVYTPLFSSEGSTPKLYIVSLSVDERKDDDYSNIGSP